MIKKLLFSLGCLTALLASFYISGKYVIKANNYKQITKKRVKNIQNYAEKYYRKEEWGKTNCGYYLRSNIHISNKLYPPPLEQNNFVIIIPSYNNEQWCEKNLRSVFDQEYENYRIIFVDDNSTDHTFEIVSNYVQERKQKHRIQLIKNKYRQGALANIYHAVHSCLDDEIVILLDGDDWFAHDRVLACLNAYYTSPDVWLTYGNFIYYPSYKNGFAKPFPKNIISTRAFRKQSWVSSHLRSFYASLFKKIKLSDFLYNGSWYDMAWDYAIMYPMLEMAGSHFATVSEILYVYNRDNIANDDKVNVQKQIFLANQIAHKNPYSLLSYPPYYKKTSHNDPYKTDIVIFSYDRPLQLYACLESIYKYVKNFSNIFVIYRSSSERFNEGYTLLQNSFPQVQYLKQGKNPKADFKSLVMEAVYGEKKDAGSYVLFAVDDNIVKEEINLKECIDVMEQTRAYGFFFRLGKHVDYCYMLSRKQGIPPLRKINNDIFAWQFIQGNDDWNYPNNLDMTLYNKERIRKALARLPFHSPNIMEGHWAEIANHQELGLCFNTSKIINIPLNLVNISTSRNMNLLSTEELLNKFKDGYKMDIGPLYKIHNNSAHIEYNPTFVKR